MRNDQVDGVEQVPGSAVRRGERPQLVDHLQQVATRQGFHLRPVDRDVVVELDVRPDDRVDLTGRAAREGLQILDIRRLPVRRDAEETPAAPSPKIMRDGRTLPILSENFSTQTSSTGAFTSCISLVASSSRKANPRRPPRCRRRRASGRCRAHRRSRGATEGHQPGARARRYENAAEVAAGSRPACASAEASGLEPELLQRLPGVEPLLDPGLLHDFGGRHRRPVVGRVAQPNPRSCRRSRRAPLRSPRYAGRR